MIACKICIVRKGLKGTYNPENCDYVFYDNEGLEKHLIEIHGVRSVDKK